MRAAYLSDHFSSNNKRFTVLYDITNAIELFAAALSNMFDPSKLYRLTINDKKQALIQFTNANKPLLPYIHTVMKMYINDFINAIEFIYDDVDYILSGSDGIFINSDYLILEDFITFKAIPCYGIVTDDNTQLYIHGLTGELVKKNKAANIEDDEFALICLSDKLYNTFRLKQLTFDNEQLELLKSLIIFRNLTFSNNSSNDKEGLI